MAILLSLFTIFLYFPQITNSSPSLQKLVLPSPGPESFAFDIFGRGPYTTVADGRVLKYKGPNIGFVDYAFTSPTRTKAICDGTNNTVSFGVTCGRPLGLAFYYFTGELFIADAFKGLLVVKRNGGLATVLATSANGVPFGLPDGIDVDQLTGTVYFTDASATYGLNQIDQLISTRDTTGRLLRYHRKTRTVTELLRGLSGAAGVAISKDRSYLLVSEFVNTRIQKFWLKGPKMNTAEILLNLTGSPNKIKRTLQGDFWVAVTEQIPTLQLNGIRIDGSGNILETVTFSPHFDSSLITEVQEYNGALYLGSLYVGYVGVYKDM